MTGQCDATRQVGPPRHVEHCIKPKDHAGAHQWPPRPAELWVTFEDGLHVGVFQDPAQAEKLNALRRTKRGVDPETVCYVRADIYEAACAEITRLTEHEP